MILRIKHHYQINPPHPPLLVNLSIWVSCSSWSTMRWIPINISGSNGLGWMAESALNIFSTSTIIKLEDQHNVDKQREIWVIRLSVSHNLSAQALSADLQSNAFSIFGIDGFREPNSSTIQGERCGWLNTVGGWWASHSNHPMEDHHL